jgi:hypothetical protein
MRAWHNTHVPTFVVNYCIMKYFLVLNAHHLSDYNIKSRPDNRYRNKNDALNSEEMYEWQTIRENYLQFLVSLQLDYTPYLSVALQTFKIRSLSTPLTYLTTFRTCGCIHSRSRRTTARQNSRIRKVSYMQPYVSNRAHKKCSYETPGSYTNITTVFQTKTNPTHTAGFQTSQRIFKTKLVVLLPSEQLLNIWKYHQVGYFHTLIHDARKHEPKASKCFTFARSEILRAKQVTIKTFWDITSVNYLTVGASLEVCMAVWLTFFWDAASVGKRFLKSHGDNVPSFSRI